MYHKSKIDKVFDVSGATNSHDVFTTPDFL